MRWHCIKFLIFFNLLTKAFAFDSWGDIHPYIAFPQSQNEINQLGHQIRSEIDEHISLGHGLFEDGVFFKFNSLINSAFEESDYRNIASSVLRAAPHAQYLVFDITQLNASQLNNIQKKLYFLQNEFLAQKNAIKFGLVIDYGTEPQTSARILQFISQSPNVISYLEIQGDWVGFLTDSARQLKNAKLNIDFLNLSTTEINTSNVQNLVGYLNGLSNLRAINLSSTMRKSYTNGHSADADAQILKPIANALKNFSNLSYLHLSSNQFAEPAAFILADLIKQLKNIAYMNAGYNQLGGSGANELLKSLALQTYLSFIAFEYNLLDVQNADDFVNMMQNKSSIAYIDASYNYFSTDGSNKIRVAISNVLILQSLQVFKLRKNYYVFQHFAQEIKISDNFSKLFYIDIGENYFYKSTSPKKLKNDKFAPAVKYLYLDSNNLNEGRFAQIANEFIHAAYLNYLDISNNQIGSDGVKPLVQILTRSKTLMGVNLSGNTFSKADMLSITKALTTFPKMQTLLLGNNQTDVESIKLLAQYFGQNRGLNSLDLSNMNLSDESAIILAEGLKAQKDIEVLNLRYNDIDRTGLKFILDSLKDKTRFTTLMISGNFVSCDDVAKMINYTSQFECL